MEFRSCERRVKHSLRLNPRRPLLPLSVWERKFLFLQVPIGMKHLHLGLMQHNRASGDGMSSASFPTVDWRCCPDDPNVVVRSELECSPLQRQLLKGRQPRYTVDRPDKIIPQRQLPQRRCLCYTSDWLIKSSTQRHLLQARRPHYTLHSFIEARFKCQLQQGPQPRNTLDSLIEGSTKCQLLQRWRPYHPLDGLVRVTPANVSCASEDCRTTPSSDSFIASPSDSSRK